MRHVLPFGVSHRCAKEGCSVMWPSNRRRESNRFMATVSVTTSNCSFGSRVRMSDLWTTVRVTGAVDRWQESAHTATAGRSQRLREGRRSLVLMGSLGPLGDFGGEHEAVTARLPGEAPVDGIDILVDVERNPYQLFHQSRHDLLEKNPSLVNRLDHCALFDRLVDFRTCVTHVVTQPQAARLVGRVDGIVQKVTDVSRRASVGGEVEGKVVASRPVVELARPKSVDRDADSRLGQLVSHVLCRV